MDDPRFPIGAFAHDKEPTPEKRAGWIRDIAAVPAALRRAVAGLSGAQLDTPYREGGWTVRQVVHHIADSHMNSFVRFKLALTENLPTIKPYDQNAWAATGDVKGMDIAASLSLVDGLHARWAALLSSLKASDFGRTFMHPESGPNTLDRTLQLYAWHGKHHVAHITTLRDRMGWK
jgi:uncharacterized damage-inducible protein DinB